MRKRGLCEERPGAGAPALPLPGVRLPFHRHAARGKPPAMKALAILLYGMGSMSFSMIGRVLGVSDVAVLKWVRAEAAALPERAMSESG